MPDQEAKGLAVEGRVQMVAIITGDGRVESAALFKGDYLQLAHSALEDFRCWRFRPASRNGNAVAVEIIVEIPFRGSFRLADGAGQND
ncbi:MAG: hypothetical protein GY953_21185 [bacterium]|nr:hypothetical protein [bacterium]